MKGHGMRILRGAEVSARIKEQVREELEKLQVKRPGFVPKLAIVRLGENPDDVSYERGAIKKMENFGLQAQSYSFPQDISNEEFKARFREINENPDVTGILLLKPLPKQIQEKEIDRMILPEKDLDGISPVNMAKIFMGDGTGFAPCTAEAVVEVLKANEIPIAGKSNNRRTKPDCGKTVVYADDERKRNGDSVPYQDLGSCGNLQAGGDSCGGCRKGQDVKRRACGTGCRGY